MMNSSDTKVSIICGFYNRENRLEESVESLINQSHKNLEIILFDDCSTDNTLAKLKKYETDFRVKIIQHKENIGFVSGLINAIQVASGKYIAIHGSGDISEPNRIEEQVHILNTKPAIGVVGCGVTNVKLDNENNTVYEHYRYKPCDGNQKYGILTQNFFTHGEVMFRKDKYDEVGGYRKEFKYAQDRDLWCRMSRVCDFYTINKPLYRRFYMSDGVGTVKNKLLIQRHLSEFACQCHEEVLAGGRDYLEEFGEKGFFFFKVNKRFAEGFERICREKVKGNEIEDSKFFASYIFSHYKGLVAIKCYVLYNVLNGKPLILKFKLKKSLKNLLGR